MIEPGDIDRAICQGRAVVRAIEALDAIGPFTLLERIVAPLRRAWCQRRCRGERASAP